MDVLYLSATRQHKRRQLASFGKERYMQTEKWIIVLAALFMVAQCHALRTTHDFGNGWQIFKSDDGTTRISFDSGNTWITVQSPIKYSGGSYDRKDRHKQNNYAAEYLAEFDPFAGNGYSCKGRIFVVKSGSAKKLDSGYNKGELVNLKPKIRTLSSGLSNSDYVKYIYIEKISRRKLLDLLERYYKTYEFKNSFDYTSQGEYGLYEIKYPIEVMSFTHSVVPYDGRSEFLLSHDKVRKLKRGYLLDAGTFMGIIECVVNGTFDF